MQTPEQDLWCRIDAGVSLQDSLLEEHKGDIKGMQQMKRKNLGLILDRSWTQQAPYQDHCLINLNAVKLIIASTQSKETNLWLKLLHFGKI